MFSYRVWNQRDAQVSVQLLLLGNQSSLRPNQHWQMVGKSVIDLVTDKHYKTNGVRPEHFIYAYTTGLAVPLVGVNAFATAAPLLNKVVVVKEQDVALAVLRLIEVEKAVVEGAGASGLAAILAGLLPELKGKK